jgi:hypothetical protein
MDAGNLVLGVAVSQDGRWVVSEWNEDVVHRKRSIVIDSSIDIYYMSIVQMPSIK